MVEEVKKGRKKGKEERGRRGKKERERTMFEVFLEIPGDLVDLALIPSYQTQYCAEKCKTFNVESFTYVYIINNFQILQMAPYISMK